MSIEKVRSYLQQFHVEDRIQEFEVSSATVELAARALNCDLGHIAKTLSFKVNEKAVLIVTSGDVRIDNRKFKTIFGTKAKMLTAEEVKNLVGYAVGGVCPFAVNDGVEIYLDLSLQRFNIVYPACGSSNSGIGLTPSELEKFCFSKGWIDVSKPCL